MGLMRRMRVAELMVDRNQFPPQLLIRDLTGRTISLNDFIWGDISPPVAATPAAALQGPTGDKGATGDKGPPGPTGAVGPDGAPGPTGPSGPMGAAGTDGAPGPTGDKGPRGDKGAQGDTGAMGSSGPPGIKGPTGDKGPQGDAGPTGVLGLQGSKGPTGDKGPQGDPGPTGLPGLVISEDTRYLRDVVIDAIPLTGAAVQKLKWLTPFSDTKYTVMLTVIDKATPILGGNITVCVVDKTDKDITVRVTGGARTKGQVLLDATAVHD